MSDTIRLLLCALACGAAATGCHHKLSVDERPTIRLSPLSASAEALDAGRIVDRDTTVAVPVERTTTLTVRFPHEVEVRRVKVHGARSLRVLVPGLALGAADPSGWASGTLEAPLEVRELAVVLEPTGTGAQLGEIEVWGAGLGLAPRDVRAIAAHTQDPDAPPFENAWVLRASSPDATLQPRGSGEGSACVHARFPPGDPRQARRAFLAFEANVPRAAVLQHSLNGGPPVNGFWLGSTSQSRTLVAEIDPEQLRGSDEILTCLPDGAGAPVELRGLRLILLLDDGVSAFDRETMQRLGEAVDGDETTAAALAAVAHEIGFDRPLDVDDVRLHLGRVPARLRVLAAREGTEWREHQDLELTASPATLPVSGRADALRLQFAGPARADVPAASVAEVAVTGSGLGPRAGAPRIVVTYPPVSLREGREIGERFGDEAYLSGWAESPSGRGAVEIEGARVDSDGAFSELVRRPAGSGGSWPVTLRARFPDGTEIARIIHLDDDRERELFDEGASGDGSGSDDLRFGRENQSALGAIDPAAGGKVKLGTDVELEAPPGAVSARTGITITRKGHEVVPQLEAGMINVTAPAHAAYRFLPRGQKFAKPVKLKIPYDPDLLPEGVAPEEIQTYYFDETKDRWFTLPRREVLRGSRQVVSETTHFTFMINAVLVLPDHPGPVSFNPNSIKDLKAADPSAGIDLVEPPQGNNEGSANLSFPIRVPRARGAYQPSLGIGYSSHGGNGWLGVGWDLAVPRVTIDSRYGVPEYTGSERYVLDGQTIVPVDKPAGAPSPTCLDGSSALEYRARVQRDFRKILRCGPDPARYWFQVTDKAGTLFVYGRSENARLASYLPRITSTPVFPPLYDIAEWYLERVVDANGNLTQLGYQHDSPGAVEPVHNEPFRQVYLRSIQYTGYVGSRRDISALEGGTQGPYLVELRHRPAPRQDEVISARSGFKTVTRRVLEEFDVRLLGGSPSGLVRRYVLSYKPGDFGKSLLDKIVVKGADEREFYSHTFEYEEKASEQQDVKLFGQPVPWIGPGHDDALTASEQQSFGFHGFVGIGFKPKKAGGTVGVGFGYGRRQSKTLASMLDLNGDGLPDRVYAGSTTGNKAILFNQGQGLSTTPPAWDPGAAFEKEFALDPDHRLGKEVGNSFDASVQAFFASASLNIGASYALSSSNDFVIDANGDGLPDLVNEGKVLLNKWRSASCLTESQSCCPASGFCFKDQLSVPALEDLGDSAELVKGDPTIAAANEAMDEALTPEDALLEWTAPYAGAVDVSGQLAFVKPPGSGERRDGVRLRVYRYDPLAEPPTTELEGTWVKAPDDETWTPVQLGNVPVGAGTILYFVLSTLSDFPMNDAQGDVSPVEQVSFAPVITYRGVPAIERDLKGPSGAPLYRFDAAKDFVLAGDPQGAVTAGRTGRIAFDLELTKQPTSDEVRVCIQYQPPPADEGSPPPRPGACSKDDKFYRKFAPEERLDAQTIVAPELEVEAGGTLYFRIDTHVAIDPRSVEWKAGGSYVCVNEGGACVTPDEKEKPYLSFRTVPYMRLHDQSVTLEKPFRLEEQKWKPSGRPLKPFKVTKRGTITIESGAQSASTAIKYTVRTLNRLLFFREGSHGEYGVETGYVPVRTTAVLEPDDLVFFEAHSESVRSFDTVCEFDTCYSPTWDLSCSFKKDEGGIENCGGLQQFTSDGHADTWDGGNQPVLAGGFHGWRYGSWNGKDGTEFEPWVYRGPTKKEMEAWNGDATEDAVNGQAQEMNKQDNPQRRRLLLAGLLVPSATGTKLRPDQDDAFEDDGFAFVSEDGNTYFTPGRMHAGRKGEGPSKKDPIAADTTGELARFEIGKIGRSSAAVTWSGSLGIGVSVLSAGVGLNAGLSQQKMDVLDMNGDGIIDVVVGAGMPGALSDASGVYADSNGKTSHIRITDPVSLDTRRTVAMKGFPQITRDVGGQLNAGASAPMRELKSNGTTQAMVSRFPGFGAGLAFSVGSVLQQLVDVNGDGLPDLVRVGADCSSGVGVRLNMGTSFAESDDCLDLNPEEFENDSVLEKLSIGSSPALRRSNTVTLQGTSGADLVGLKGGVDPTESYGVSFGAETSLTATNVALVDVTGDGLPDYVYKGNQGNDFAVLVNTGYGFQKARSFRAEAPWCSIGGCPNTPRLRLGLSEKVRGILAAFTGSESVRSIEPLEATGSHSTQPSLSFAFNFTFPLWLPSPWMHIGAGASGARAKVSGFELGLQDIDGDGLPDQVLKSSDNALVWARLNQLGKANLLKRVVRPLGGSIELAYDQRVGNTVDMPQSRWVLTDVTVRDGRAPSPGAPGHDLVIRYAYEGGRYDRLEREFLGFARVTRLNQDETRVEQVFANATPLQKGLLLSERVLRQVGGEERPWVVTENTWTKGPNTTPSTWCRVPVLLDAESYCSSTFVKLDAVEKRFHEGEPTPGIVRRQEFDYDDATGDVIAFRDFGDVAEPSDDLFASIAYANDDAAKDLYSVSRPESVEIRDRDGRLLRSRSARYDANGNIEHFEAPLGDGRIAETDLHWNTRGIASGTLDWVEGPKNEAGDRYETTYGYDGVTGTYVTSITDSHGYTSTVDEYDFRFGEATRTTDVNGKVTARRFDAFGRLERLAGPKDTLDAPTVSISYAHAAKPAFARTRNRLPRKEGDVRGTVDTVVVMDGIGRVIQTKKTAEIATSETAKGVGWSVTGHQVFDVMGRVALQGQAFASFSSRPEFVSGTPRNPTRFIYDDLGRMIETVEPNGALTRVQYGFGTPAGSIARRFRVLTTDAEGRAKAAFKDAADRVVAVEERIEGRTPTTQYQYNPVGDLLRVVDAAGNVTRLDYDLLGRRTLLDNPDTGELRFELDPAGNVVRKYDPNLRAKSGFIHYIYHYDQLVRIEYPDASRNVTFTYGKGADGAAKNGLGRVVEVKDDAGRELRSYDELGSLVSTTRVLRAMPPYFREQTFTTSFSWDSFGRMMSITYPDGETVEYEYDAGGLLEKATGHRGAGGAVPGDEVYLESLLYDEFGQRVRMVLGNGVATSYGYDPLTRRLASLTTKTPLGRKLQAIAYGYDRVGNVKTMVNGLGNPVGDRSGEVRFEYGYDELYRLIYAQGRAKSRQHTVDRFTATYAYDDIHNMTANVQVHEILHGGQTVGHERPPKTNHEFAYQYDPAHPHRATKIGNTFLTYDENGNTVRECRDHSDPTCATSADHLRRYVWDDENRLAQVIDGGGKHITRFVYDAAGERVVKLGRGGESITIGQFWSLKGRRAATKQVFAGATRLASKLLPPPGWGGTPLATTALTSVITASTTLGGGTSTEEVPNGCDPSNYQPQKCPALPGGEPTINHQYDDTRVRPETYYYHPDHLGSTSWVTDQHARVHEHVEYFPYGAVWRDARSDSDRGPKKGQRFLFTGKELDEETGLYYFGARYYDPRRATWKSVDPKLPELLTNQLPQLPRKLSLYSYVLNNPLVFFDPDGRDAVVLHGGFIGTASGVEVLSETVRGSYQSQIKEYRPEIDYNDWSITNDDPTRGVTISETYKHESDPRVLAGYSIGGDAALRAGKSEGGKPWDLRVVVGAKVDAGFVSQVEKAAKTSNRLVIVGIIGDKNMANDGLLRAIGGEFGDRSYEAIVGAIVAKYGSMENFYKAFPKVSVQPSVGAHTGGGNRPETQEAIRRGLKEIEGR